EKYKKNRKESGISPACINRDLTCLKKMFNVAGQWKLVGDNPVRHVQPLREAAPMIKTLEEEKEAVLLDSGGFAWDHWNKKFVPDARSQHLKPIVILALDTGMRRSEILTLRWEQIDWTNGLITLVKTKGNKKRILPMSGRVRQILASRQEESTAEY